MTSPHYSQIELASIIEVRSKASRQFTRPAADSAQLFWNEAEAVAEAKRLLVSGARTIEAVRVIQGGRCIYTQRTKAASTAKCPARYFVDTNHGTPVFHIRDDAGQWLPLDTGSYNACLNEAHRAGHSGNRIEVHASSQLIQRPGLTFVSAGDGQRLAA